jgi:hypothetical protein
MEVSGVSAKQCRESEKCIISFLSKSRHVILQHSGNVIHISMVLYPLVEDMVGMFGRADPTGGGTGV